VPTKDELKAKVSGWGWGLAIALIAGAVGLFLFVALSAPTPNQGFNNSAAVLAVVGATALGIERLLEVIWTIVGQRNSKWPKGFATEVNSSLNGLDDQLKLFFAGVTVQLDSYRKAAEDLRDTKDAAIKYINSVEAQIAAAQKAVGELGGMAPDNKRVEYVRSLVAQVAGAVQQAATVAHATDKEFLTPTYDGIMAAIAGVKDFVSTFEDNPGRRLISLGAGAILGVSVAGYLGLDLFHAILDETGTNAAQAMAIGFDPTRLSWGVALTGLVMGLGSNPTHEVIKAVTEFKKQLKG
jgi:hypothetical protein